MQCPKGSHCFCFQATLAFIRSMTSLGRPLCRCAITACWKRRTVLFRSIDPCNLGLLCFCARCWMLQGMDNMEASCIFYVKVGTFTHLEQSKTSHLTVNKSGIVRLTVQHDLIVSISFVYHPGYSLRQTSADIPSLQHCPIYSWQSCDVGCCTPYFNHVNKQTTTDQHIAHCGVVGNPCNLQLYAAEFILSITNMMAANYSILTWS